MHSYVSRSHNITHNSNAIIRLIFTYKTYTFMQHVNFSYAQITFISFITHKHPFSQKHKNV